MTHYNPTELAMSDNSNPAMAGTGTADDLSDDGFDEFMAEDADDGATEDDEELEAGAEDADDDEGNDADDDEGDGDDDDAEDDADGKKADPIIKLEDGTEVPMSELTSGYLRQADYTRKTQALAAQRNEFEAMQARSREQADAQRNQLNEAFEGVVALLSARLPPEPSASLAYTDPQAYMQQRAYYDAAMQELQSVLGQQRQVNEHRAVQEAQATEQRLKAEIQRVADVYPESVDREKGKAFWQAAFGAGQKLGLSSDELSGISDHRLIIGLYKLAQYEARDAAKQQAVKQQATKQAAGQPKRPAPVAVQPRSMKASPAAKALRSFRETGSVQAAERALAAWNPD